MIGKVYNTNVYVIIYDINYLIITYLNRYPYSVY